MARFQRNRFARVPHGQRRLPERHPVHRLDVARLKGQRGSVDRAVPAVHPEMIRADGAVGDGSVRGGGFNGDDRIRCARQTREAEQQPAGEKLR